VFTYRSTAALGPSALPGLSRDFPPTASVLLDLQIPDLHAACVGLFNLEDCAHRLQLQKYGGCIAVLCGGPDSLGHTPLRPNFHLVAAVG